MPHQLIVDFARNAILMALLLAGPMLVVALGVGLIVSVIQAVTQIQEQTLAFVPKLVEDMRLAVTEACTNVVRHAYRDHEGPLEIAIEPEGGCLKVVVADRGHGILPNPSSEGPGLGLPLIAALADALEIEHSPQRGSRLALQFRAKDHEGAKEAA